MASISVVIPTYNRADLIGETIASVLAQTRAPAEILVVDDASEDGTRAVVRAAGPDVGYLRVARGGPAAARNAGAEATRGELIAFLDSDDLWLPEHLETLHGLMTAPGAEQVGAVLSWYELFDGEARSEERFVCQMFSAALLRRSALEAVGPIDPSLTFGEDTDWFFRLREHGFTVLIGDREQPTVWYRRHGTNLTNDTRTRDRHTLDAMRRSVARRRGGSASPTPFAFVRPEQGVDWRLRG